MADGAYSGGAQLLTRGTTLQVFIGTSAADTAQTISTPKDRPFKLLHIDVAYSAAPTQTGVTITLNSAAGAGYDTLLSTGTANARYTVFIPEGGEMIYAAGDAIDVLAPAAGGTITSSISIYVEAF